MARIFVLGAGGHAKVVIETLHRAGEHEIAFVADDDLAKHGTKVLGHDVTGSTEALIARRAEFPQGIVAIGDNARRAEAVRRLREAGFGFVRAVHPGAQVAQGATIGEGTLIAAGCVVQPDARIGTHAIVNTGASVDHDCVVGDFAHLGPGCRLCGGVRVGERALLGVGTSVIPGIRIGAGTLIGAGSAVVGDLPDGVRAAGNPCKPIPG